MNKCCLSRKRFMEIIKAKSRISRKIGIPLLLIFLLFAAISHAQAAWKYETSKDMMTDQNVYSAWVISKNEEELSFPYSGGTKATLYVMQQKTPIISMTINKGQFVCNDKCEIIVRLDNAAPETWLAFPSGNNSINGIYFFGTQYDYLNLPRNSDSAKTAMLNMINKLKSAKRIRIKASFYQEGNRVFEFDTSGLKWPLH